MRDISRPAALGRLAVVSHASVATATARAGRRATRRAQGHVAHRSLGDVWTVPMLYIAIGSFRIAEMQVRGRWSPIHPLSVLVVVTVPLAVWRTRRHRVRAHRNATIALYAVALVVTGLFTLWPGRTTHAVVFGS